MLHISVISNKEKQFHVLLFYSLNKVVSKNLQNIVSYLIYIFPIIKKAQHIKYLTKQQSLL